MTRHITPAGSPATGAVDEAFAEVRASFDRFCLAAGIEALGTMMEADVTAACGPRHGRDAARRVHRWGRNPLGRIGFHGGKIEVERPRVRGLDGREVTIPSWGNGGGGGLVGRWAMNLMLINVSTRRFGRAVLGCPRAMYRHRPMGVSKSAASAKVCGAVGGAAGRLHGCRIRSALDLRRSKSTRLHLGDDLVLVAAIGVDGEGNKHPLARAEGATQNAATVQALLEYLVALGRRRCQDCSSSTARKRRRRRSAAPSVRPPRSSAARSTRRATSRNACRRSCGHPSGALRQAWSSMMPTRLKIDPQSRASTRRAMARRSGQHP